MSGIKNVFGVVTPVFTAAVMAMAFLPLWQWYQESEDRARERLVQEVQVLETCMSAKVQKRTKDRLHTELEQIGHGEREIGNETTYTRLAEKCVELGFESKDLYPDL